MTTEIENLLAAKTTLVRVAALLDTAPAIIGAIDSKSNALYRNMPAGPEPEPMAADFSEALGRLFNSLNPCLRKIVTEVPSVTNLHTARCRQELRHSARRLAELDTECLALWISLQDSRLGGSMVLLEKAHSDWLLWFGEFRDLVLITQEAVACMSSP